MSEKLLLQILEKLTSIEGDVSTIKTEQEQIKQAIMETNSTVTRMELILVQQHRIIDLLSIRSIEHEATLKLIK